MIELFDSTLRDGAQGEGISYTVRDKLQILAALDEFGIDYVEAGNPFSNPKDAEFFALAAGMSLRNARLTAFGSTRRRNLTPDEDPGLASLLASGAPCAAIFGKSDRLQAERVLGVTAEENLELIHSTVAYLKARMEEVIFDAEHFFDAYAADPAYAMAVLSAAADAGADGITLCDTRGGSLPAHIASVTAAAVKAFGSRCSIGIHTHDDMGLAVAGAMAAADAGAKLVQGTFNGIGERCGNCDLSTLIPNLALKCGTPCGRGGIRLEALTGTARHIAELTNASLRKGKPYVGKSAFAHKGGMHIDATEKLEGAYEHVDPALVGNKRRLLLSEVAGKTTIFEKMKSFAPDVDRSSPEIARAVETLKEYEHAGYQFEAADASFELLVRKKIFGWKPPFTVVLYKATDDFPSTDGKLQAGAMIQVEVDGVSETAASLGNGPVNALDLALKRALTVFYPAIADVRLTDFKVRVLESNSTTAARVRVLIESADNIRTWTTVGVSNDIIEASFIALSDALEYKILQENHE